MRQLLPALFLLCLTGGCKKTIEDIQEDLVIRAMTDGQWAISSFTLNGSDITADYTSYRFKYHNNRTVDAIRNGTVERTGNWSGEAATMTTWAQFNGAVYPLTLINGTWNILRNGWTYVEARQVSGSDIKLMRLGSDPDNSRYSLHAGGFLRWNDALIPVIKLDFAPFSMSVSYDANISLLKTNTYGRGGFEVSISYQSFRRNPKRCLPPGHRIQSKPFYRRVVV